MTVCCEHNPCPGRPIHFLGRFQNRPWVCRQCGQFWVTTPQYIWRDFDGYKWEAMNP